MPDDPASPVATGMTLDLALIASDLMNSTVSSIELATLISTIAEQNRLIKLLTERVGALEGYSPTSRAAAAESPIPSTNDTQPIPGNDLDKDSNPPGQSRVLDAQTQPVSAEENSPEDSAGLPANSSSVEHPPDPSASPEVNASAASSAPSTLSPASPLRHEAPPFSPMYPPPPFGYPPYWPHPGYHHPNHHPMYPAYPPPYWYPPPNHPSAAGPAQASPRPDTPIHNVNPVKTSGGPSDAPENDPVTASLDQWGSEPVTGWGELEDSVQKSPNKPEARLDSNDNPEPTKKGRSKVRPCKFGDECTRSDCWFEHPGRVNPEHNDNPNSTYAPDSKASISEASSSSNVTAGQPGSSTRSMPECKYADKCTRKKCWFTHPPGWSPPSRASESMPDQDAPAPNDEPADQGYSASPASNEWPGVEDDGWGTNRQESTAPEANADVGTWGTEPTNDWGTPTIDDWGPPADNDWGAPSNDGWASPPIKTAVARAPSPASNSKQAPPPKTPNPETQKGRKSRSARSRESTASSFRSQSVLSAATTQLETVDDAHDAVTEPSANDASIADPVIEPDTDDIIVDSLSTPPLEPATTPTHSPSLSELESPSTPFAWGDEPLNDSSYIDPPAEDPADLDTAAPSAMYTSWAPVEVSDWGDSFGNANAWDDTIPPVSQADHEHGGQPSAKAKGKRKDTGQGKAAAVSQAKDKRKPTNEAGPSTASTSAVPHPPAEPAISEPSPVPQGLPEEQIPDWLLGKGEDSYAVLGLSRPATPEPATTPKPSPPKPGLNRPRLSQMPGESFPALKPTPAYRPPATSVASGPLIQPVRGKGWKIVPIDAPSTPAPSNGSGQSKRRRNRPGNRPSD
ncbi:hypothetical protein FRC06_001604 [Ceratobasidium sp. 370]|nr:hypothetical protein FRC06_001604 [Ceratobasidium sp. 370]